MRFLIDRCAGRRLGAWLKSSGHDVLDSHELGADPGDQALLDEAFRQQRILVTIDTDFGHLLFVDDRPHCGVIRLPDVPTDKRIAMLEQVLARHSAELESGALVTVKRGSIRISQRPPDIREKGP